VHLCAGLPSPPLSYCFGVTLLVWRISCSTSYFQNINTSLKLILGLSSTLCEAFTFKNVIFMVKCTCVRGSLLFLLATVLVCRAGGKPSTWFPPGTRRAVHNIRKLIFEFPFFWSDWNWRKPTKFHEKFKFFENSPPFSNIHIRDAVQTKFVISDDFMLSVCWNF